MIKIAPSVLAADYASMGDAVSKLQGWGADWIHYDVMDGHFVPNISFGPDMLKAIRPHTPLTIDVHLMVTDPERWFDQFIKAGADCISFHLEAHADTAAALKKIRAAGLKAGLVIKPATPAEDLFPYLELADFVLVMSVNPGFGGQSFIETTPEKIRTIRREIDRRGLPTEIEVDGGINPTTAKLCIEAGATILVAGSSVFRSPSPEKTIGELRS